MALFSKEGSTSPNDMYRRFYDLRAEAALQAASDPEQFAAGLADMGIPRDEAAAHVRDLLQLHFNHPGMPEVTSGDSAALGAYL